MLAPSGPVAVFRAQTCIEPDRIALLARDVSQSIRGRFPHTFIRFDGATPGQLQFSVCTRFARAEVMSFCVDIARLADGFTSLDTRILADPPANRAALCLPISGAAPAAYELYKRYARELASALTRFDPLSTAVLVEQDQP
jgi:hypothetical protein